MANRTIIIGDSYGVRRPLFRYEIVDDQGDPYPLLNCTIRTTYKATATSPATDPDDTDAAIKHFITIDGSGNVTSSNGLVLDGPASDGIVIERLTSDESSTLTSGVVLSSDLELTDNSLTPAEVFTWIFVDKLVGTLAYTNRTSDV